MRSKNIPIDDIIYLPFSVYYYYSVYIIPTRILYPV